MAGHTTAPELKEIRDLERQVDSNTISEEGLLTLGILYMEPAHEETKAIRCFQTILAREPDNALARIWLAYALEHYEMDPDSLRTALELLRPLCREGSIERGAALLLSALISSELRTVDDLDSTPMLEASVTTEPAWVSNRYMLATRYRKLGLKDEAAVQVERGLQNTIVVDSSWNTLRKNYELLITWRASSTALDLLDAERRSLAGDLEDGGPRQT